MIETRIRKCRGCKQIKEIPIGKTKCVPCASITEKECIGCGKIKALDEFFTRCAKCKICMSKEVRRPCIRCGEQNEKEFGKAICNICLSKQEKYCKGCDQIKNLIDFYGRAPYCKICTSKEARCPCIRCGEKNEKEFGKAICNICLNKPDRHCKGCDTTKYLIDFYERSPYCKICFNKAQKEKRDSNIDAERLKARERNSSEEKKAEMRLRSKIYRKKNRTKINDKLKRPTQLLRHKISCMVRHALKKQNITKNDSVIKYLEYSIIELKTHIQNLFEPWMNWSNNGVYERSKWDDNDQSTWVWHLDHIIPQKDLPYVSMDDENFKKCWALSNLRPLSAQQNMDDGRTRVRHKKEEKLMVESNVSPASNSKKE